MLEFSGRHAFRGVDHHWDRPQFVTAGAGADLWDHARSEPVQASAGGQAPGGWAEGARAWVGGWARPPARQPRPLQQCQRA